MAGFERIPIAPLAIVIAIVTVVVWVVTPGPIAIVISLVVTGLLAVRAVADDNGG